VSILQNILKELSAPVTIYIDTKHCGLEQYNGSLAFDIKSCKGRRGGMGLSFRWGAFDIERLIEEKMVSTSFGEASSHGEWAPSAGATHAIIINKYTTTDNIFSIHTINYK
jgi:hypothetical protein